MTWLNLPPDSPFGVANLPYGVFSVDGNNPRAGVRIGDAVLDLAATLDDPVFAQPSLNVFMAQGPTRWREVRARLSDLLTDERHRATVEPALFELSRVRLRLPFTVADYVNFDASEHHARTMGRMLLPDAEPLPANWRHLPMGYYSRSGTVVVSGTPVTRPQGQRKAPDETEPSFGPSRRLDFEAEVGFVVGTGSHPGRRVPIEDFREHVFGVCLVNDWAARDIQEWERVPLGPFLGTSFATSVSPWVVPLEALEQARVAAPPRDPHPLDYLRDTEEWGLDLELEIRLNGHVLSRPPFAAMYWTPSQLLAHLTGNGASIGTGDLYASGAVSGPDRDQRGSLAELSWNGAEPVELPDGTTRGFLADGDEVTITATAPGPAGSRIGFGAVTGQIMPAASPAGWPAPRS
ncbi:fumarylacetoacetase [Salinactinospora qingdaonensis]|uniref:fumarylacetoacetase n=1 Tax=Salinactinospora qingdaonensis TaxID=702744 RepID=A0ABP7G4W1_9ACTN